MTKKTKTIENAVIENTKELTIEVAGEKDVSVYSGLSTKIEEGVKILVRDGAPIKKIRAYLTMEDVTEKRITKIVKTLGGGKKAGFADGYYAWLSAEKRTMDEASAYILGEGENEPTSDNVKKHLSHYLNIAKLTINVWESK